MRKKSIPLLFLLIFCVFVVMYSLVHSQNGNRQNLSVQVTPLPGIQVTQRTEAEIAEIKATQEMDEAIQMAPTASRVLSLSTETLEESFLKLATYDDGQYFQPGYIPPDDFECIDMQVLLSNRRVIKILQDFEKLPLDQAKTKAKGLHKIAMDYFYMVVENGLDQYEKYSFIEHTDDLKHVNFMATTSLLLSASLGDVPFLIQRIEEWEQTLEKLRKRILLNEKKYPPNTADAYLPYSSHSSFFDPTGFVSILMFAVERSGNYLPLHSEIWNANKTYYDDLRHREGGNLSWENTQMFFRIYNLPCKTELYNRQGKELFQSVLSNKI